MKLILGVALLTLGFISVDASAHESRRTRNNKADMKSGRFQDRNFVDFEFREMREQRRAIFETEKPGQQLENNESSENVSD